MISIAGAKKHDSRVAYAFTYRARTCDLTLMATRSVGAAYMKQTSERFQQAGSKLRTPEQGAATSVLLATWPPLDGIGGRYFENCHVAETVTRRTAGTIRGVAP